MAHLGRHDDNIRRLFDRHLNRLPAVRRYANADHVTLGIDGGTQALARWLVIRGDHHSDEVPTIRTGHAFA